jgi:predicted house-cleaning noncanonical NTP pyrophosphatase (MazG superfamily)
MTKLIRDKIPDIMAAKWQTATTYVADDSEYLARLVEKLQEEVTEAWAADEIHLPEELADIIEVINAICVARGLSLDEVEKIRIKKLEERGGFEKKLILVQ